MSTSLSLTSFPEELLLRILALTLAHPPPSIDAFSLYPSQNRIAPLLVSRQFFRITAPLFYHTLHFHSSYQVSRALDTLTRWPALACEVRRLVFGGIWHGCAGVLTLCEHVQDVDVCLNMSGICSTSIDIDGEAFCSALEQRRAIAHLTIRKDPAVYLTHPRPTYVLQRLVQAIESWSQLVNTSLPDDDDELILVQETVHFALRISSSPSTMPLARALSMAPRLRCVRAQLPAVWNTFLLVVSTNPRLEKVMLYVEPVAGPRQGRSWNSALMASSLSVAPAATVTISNKGKRNWGRVADNGKEDDDVIEYAVLGTGMYMMEARKHTRFSELVKAGTSIIRTRAHTTVATVSTPSTGGTTTQLGAIRAKEVAIQLMDNRDGFGATTAVAQSPTAARHAQAHDNKNKNKV